MTSVVHTHTMYILRTQMMYCTDDTHTVVEHVNYAAHRCTYAALWFRMYNKTNKTYTTMETS
jgi:hypothetical protein